MPGSRRSAAVRGVAVAVLSMAALAAPSAAQQSVTADAEAVLTAGSWAMSSPAASAADPTPIPTPRSGRRQLPFSMSILLSIVSIDSPHVRDGGETRLARYYER